MNSDVEFTPNSEKIAEGLVWLWSMSVSHSADVSGLFLKRPTEICQRGPNRA